MKCLKAFDVLQLGEFTRRSITACVAGLPIHLAEREVDVIRRGLDWDESEARCDGGNNWRLRRRDHPGEISTGIKSSMPARKQLSDLFRCQCTVKEGQIIHEPNVT